MIDLLYRVSKNQHLTKLLIASLFHDHMNLLKFDIVLSE